MEKQANIILHQQLFLENLDHKARETNLIVLGVPDDGQTLDGATNDDAKLGRIWAAIGEVTVIRSPRRLGQYVEGTQKKRPLLIVVDAKTARDGVLEKAKSFKGQGHPLDYYLY